MRTTERTELGGKTQAKRNDRLGTQENPEKTDFMVNSGRN